MEGYLGETSETEDEYVAEPVDFYDFTEQYIETMKVWDDTLFYYPEEMWEKCRPTIFHLKQYLYEEKLVLVNYEDFFWRVPKNSHEYLLSKHKAIKLMISAYEREERIYGENN